MEKYESRKVMNNFKRNDVRIKLACIFSQRDYQVLYYYRNIIQRTLAVTVKDGKRYLTVLNRTAVRK